MEIKDFNHKIDEVVKFHEVDLMGICNNAVYFNYFEDARVKYLKDLKKNYQLDEIMEDDSFFIMAHNECDYIIPAHFDEELIVYTRITEIRNSSFDFVHLIVNKKSYETIAVGSGVLVHINMKTKKSMALPNEFYEAVEDYEKGVNINKNS